MTRTPQLSLFGEDRSRARARERGVEPASPSPELVALGEHLPASVRLGTSSWSFPGWQGIVWQGEHDTRTLAREGLSAYARHPLLRAVGVDRTHYAPVDVPQLEAWARAVPDDFRFLVKAHDEITLRTFPWHARYGERKGTRNARFLDAAYASDIVVGPCVEGLGDKLGVLLFQLAAQDVAALGGPEGFAAQVHTFFSRLPKGPRYALEVRNPALLCDAYRDALLDVGVSHCLNAIAGMPPLREQVWRVQKAVGAQVVVRWLLRSDLGYDEAYRRYAPFTRVVDDDAATRKDIVDILSRALATEREALVIVNNKAEGCSPLSIERVARELAGRLSEAPAPPAKGT